MIGILGGTFDPVHFGHLNTAREVSQALELERVILVPAATPPHRPTPVANIEHRINMLKLAIPMYEGFELDDREQRMGGISYTVRTLESYRSEYGDHSIGLILGIDAFAGLESWHQWQRIPELANIIVMNRPGYDLTGLPAWAQSRVTNDLVRMKHTAAGLIMIVDVTPVAVSATQIRDGLAKQESVDDLLPDAVLNYIETNRLYN